MISPKTPSRPRSLPAVLKDTDLILELIAEYKKNVSDVIDIDEFRNEASRFRIILKALREYKRFGKININLTLNHTVIVHNVFDCLATDVLINSAKDDDEIEALTYSLLNSISRLPHEYHDQVDDEFSAMIEQTIKENNNRTSN